MPKENIVLSYTFDELPEKVREKVIEKLSDINVDYEWYDYIYEQWVEKLAELGYPDAKIQFSGFYSQGDGASFVSGIDSNILVNRFITNTELKELIKDCTFYGKVYRTNYQYVHWNSVSAEITDVDYSEEIYNLQDSDDENDNLKYNGIANAINVLMDQLGKYVTEDVHDLSKQIYNELEKEYDWLTDKEQIIDSIQANSYEFDEYGNTWRY